MDFVNVTDVKIPQGDVIKITETSTGRILWEKVTTPTPTPTPSSTLKFNDDQAAMLNKIPRVPEAYSNDTKISNQRTTFVDVFAAASQIEIEEDGRVFIYSENTVKANEAKDIIESTPYVINENISNSEARNIKNILERARAEVVIR